VFNDYVKHYVGSGVSKMGEVVHSWSTNKKADFLFVNRFKLFFLPTKSVVKCKLLGFHTSSIVIMQELSNYYNSLTPDKERVKAKRRELLREVPGTPLPLYAGGIVMIMVLAMGFSVLESDSPKITFNDDSIVVDLNVFKEIIATVKVAKESAVKVEKIIKNQILTARAEIAPGEELSPLARLERDLQTVQITKELLDEIETDIENGDFVIAREKIDKFLNLSNMEGSSSEVEGETIKEEIKAEEF